MDAANSQERTCYAIYNTHNVYSQLDMTRHNKRITENLSRKSRWINIPARQTRSGITETFMLFTSMLNIIKVQIIRHFYVKQKPKSAGSEVYYFMKISVLA